jgi:hypothetical protein
MANPISPAVAPTTAPAVKVVEDKSKWEYVEIPETDLFDSPFGSIQVNFEPYGPGKHFVNPELAGEIRRLLKQRHNGDVRILRPTQDKKMQEIMARTGKPVSYNPDMSSIDR